MFDFLYRSRVSARQRTLLSLLFVIAGVPAVSAQMSLSLTPSVPSGAPVGTQVIWTAAASNPNHHPYRYKFLVHAQDRAGRILKDFSPENTLNWLPSEEEGLYTVEVTARDLETGDSAQSVATFNLTPAVTGTAPVVSPTVHPLVMLYSTPPCPFGSSMAVYY